VSGDAPRATDPAAVATEPDAALLRRYRDHDDQLAREVLVERHMPLVRSLARRYAGRGEPLDDIEQVGAIGLIKAIDRYDLERGVALSTYATPTVVGEIKRHFRDRGWSIRIPRSLQELSQAIPKAMERVGAELGRSPSLSELAVDLGVSLEEVLEALEAGSAYAPDSLSGGPVGAEERDPMEALGGEDVEFDRFEQRAALEPALETLPDRERTILRMRFVEGLTQTEIAERVGVSQMHVSRLIRKSLALMRSEMEG